MRTNTIQPSEPYPADHLYEAYDLVCEQRLTYAVAAKRLGCGVGTVQRRVTKYVRERYGVDPEPVGRLKRVAMCQLSAVGDV